MILAISVIMILILLVLAVFYLIIRMKDIHKNLSELAGKMPLTDEMRKEASLTIASLNERMGVLSQKAERITEVMNSVTSLRNLFMMPKGAGGAGERLLEKALYDILPADTYSSQYGLSSGTVDFVIKFKDCIVPIDSKLSLESFSKVLSASDENAKKAFWKSFANDVKKRIDETSKYILPNEKTTDFALMYIPSEHVYYEAFVRDKQFGENNTIIDYAIKKKVYPTSPQTIYPYLMTILQGMKALKIEENAKDILGRISGLRNDFERFRSIYNIIISHIDDARKKHDNEGTSAIAKIDQHISNLEQKSK